MIVLDAATKALEAKLAGAVATNNLPWDLAYVETLDSDQSVSDIGETNGVITGSGAAILLTGPAAGKTRTVKAFTIHNADTTGATITVQVNDAATLRTKFKATILTLENLEYND